MTAQSQEKKAEITKADRRLQTKAGTGTIAAEKIQNSQEKIDSNAVDFTPIGMELLDKFAAAIKAAQEDGKESAALMEGLKTPVMGMKASAAMFGYPLASAVSDGLLDFLETCETIDKDIITVAEAHYKTLQLVVSSKMTGDGGAVGAEFRKELESARKRYSDKDHNKKAPPQE